MKERTPSGRWKRWLFAKIKHPLVVSTLQTFGSMHPTFLVMLVVTEQFRWFRFGDNRSLFEIFYALSVFYGIVIGGPAIASSLYLFRRGAPDKRADPLTIVRRLLVIPGLYLLSALWSSAWLSGRPSRGFGAAVATLYLADQILSNLYHAFLQRPDAAPGEKDPTAGAAWATTRLLWSQLSLKAREIEKEARRRWWRRTHPNYLRQLPPRERALYESAMRGDSHNVEIFLKRGANPNLTLNFDVPLISECASKGHTEVVRLLQNAGASVNAASPVDGFTALHRAAAQGYTEAARRLAEGGAQLDARTKGGSTALIFAARNGYTEIVSLLLQCGAPPDSVDKFGCSALIAAASKQNHDVLRALLAAGANAKIKANDGSSALIAAAVKGHADVVTLLLEHGARINDVNIDGQTALFCAANHGHSAAIEALLAAGADATIKTLSGKTALQTATERGHAASAALFAPAHARGAAPVTE